LVYRTYISRKDESAVGFVLVDTRTKETIFINREVQQNMRLKVQRRKVKKRISGFQSLISIIPTYVMKDKRVG
jgi:hypothetical protein